MWADFQKVSASCELRQFCSCALVFFNAGAQSGRLSMFRVRPRSVDSVEQLRALPFVSPSLKPRDDLGLSRHSAQVVERSATPATAAGEVSCSENKQDRLLRVGEGPVRDSIRFLSDCLRCVARFRHRHFFPTRQPCGSRAAKWTSSVGMCSVAGARSKVFGIGAQVPLGRKAKQKHDGARCHIPAS